MKLFTFQTTELYDRLMQEGSVHCDQLSDFAKDWMIAYRWMAEQLNKKVGPAPDGCTMPLWAWYQFSSRKKKRPALAPRCMSCGAERGVLLELEVPDQEVLLSDFDLWHFVLNKTYICPRNSPFERKIRELEREAGKYLSHEALPFEVRKEVEASWQKIFDLHTQDKYYQPLAKRNRRIQAVLWSVKKEFVISAVRLEAKGENLVAKKIF